MICHYEQICTGLGRRVRAGSVKRGILGKEEIRAVKRKITVHLIGGNLMKTLDSKLTAGVKKSRGSHYVCADKDVRIGD